MKKQFLKSLALVAMLLCGLTASAVDWSSIKWAGDGAGGGAFANKYKVATPEGVSLVNIQKPGFATEAGFYITFPDAAFGEVRINGEKTNYAFEGAGICLYVSNFTAKETEVQVMNLDNSAVRWTLYVYYDNGIETGGEEKETIKPVMGAASLASVTYNSAVVNVAGTDKETEDGKVVAVNRFKVVYGETTKIYTATDGKITITGLNAGTTYSFSIYAVDAVGNVSDNSASVKATTESRESQCSGECGHFGNPTVKRIAYTIAYDPTEKAVVYTISALNGKKLDFMEVHTTKGNYRVEIPTNDSTTCTFTQTGLTEGEELAILFLYSTDEIGGNEMTAEQVSMSDPNIIYYKVGDCAMVIEEDTEKPVMVEATFASATYTSITLNVSATDNVAVKRYHVVTTGVDKDILPSNGQIVITGLTVGTTYTIEVTAKDVVGNESANKATVSDVKTLSYPAAPAAPVHAQDKVRSIYSDTYTSALAHDFAKNMWSGIQYKEITLDENNHYLFYTANVNWIAWGDNNDGANAIIAAEGYNDGTQKGLDLSVMDYLHVDIFVDTECVSGEVTINDERLAGLGTLEGGKWNSLNLSLESLKSGLTEEKKEGKINSTRWIKFVGLNGVSMVIIDNVYAWKNGTSTAVDAQEVATKVSKMIENGQVVIIREGVKYDVTGRAIER